MYCQVVEKPYLIKEGSLIAPIIATFNECRWCLKLGMWRTTNLAAGDVGESGYAKGGAHAVICINQPPHEL